MAGKVPKVPREVRTLEKLGRDVRVYMTVVAAVAVAAVGGTTWLATTTSPDPSLPVTSWIVALCVIPLSHFHVGVSRKSDDVQVTFEAAGLVFLLLTGATLWSGLLWCLATLIGIMTTRRRLSSRIFNISLAWLSAMGYIGVYRLVGESGPTSLSAAVAVLIGTLVGLIIDISLTGVQVHLARRVPLRDVLNELELGATLTVLLAITSLGFLGALVTESTAAWGLVLLVLPTMSVIIASRSARRSREDQRRLQVLLDSSRDRHGLDARDDILASALLHAQRLLATDEVAVRSEPPDDGEVGAPIDNDDAPRQWLVGMARAGRIEQVETDRRALESLAADTSESLARSRLITELTLMARTDGLTGLASRGVFSAQVARCVPESQRRGERVAVLYIDLNGFKIVNDRFGHHVGDMLVKLVADRLVGYSRPGQLIARLGGDEFAILIERVVDPSAVVGHARRMVEAISRECVVDGHSLSIGASIGIAFSSASTAADELLRDADMAMYEAKSVRDGEPRVFHPSMRERVVKRAELQEELDRAVTSGQLWLEYQPVVDMRNGVIHGVEALARWNHPRRGVLSAGAFIDIAEDSGLIIPLGEWVLRQMLEDAPQLEAAVGHPLSIAVNVSPRQLADDRIVDTVVEVLEQNTTRSQIVLELTESIVIDDDPAIRSRLSRIVAAGAALAMDDFGVGYSSVGYLRWLPLSVLKLDRSLVQAASEDQQGRDLVEAILLMGRSMGLKVVSEGVESLEQVELLKTLGATYGQGFHLARPLGIEALTEYFSAVSALPQPRAEENGAAETLAAGAEAVRASSSIAPDAVASSVIDDVIDRAIEATFASYDVVLEGEYGGRHVARPATE